MRNVKELNIRALKKVHSFNSVKGAVVCLDTFFSVEEKLRMVQYVQRTFENPTEEEQEVLNIIEQLLPDVWRKATRQFFTNY